MRLDLISPLLILLVGAVLTLLVGIFLPRDKQRWNAGLALLVLGAAGVAALTLRGTHALIFDGSFVVDEATVWTQLMLFATAAASILLAIPVFRNDAREGEFYSLLLFTVIGTVVLAGAADMMEIVLGVLLSSIGGYVLVAYRRSDPLALEAVLKYYLVGALTNMALIFGFALLYGLSGSTQLGTMGEQLAPGSTLLLSIAVVLVLVGIGFKAGFVPAHFWMPDALQAASTPVAALLSVAPKLAALLALAHVMEALPLARIDWPLVLAIIAAVTMSWGNLAAWRQENLQRLLAYSSISQSGYMLLALVALPDSSLALPALLFYFAAYLAANFGAFAVVGALGKPNICDGAGLARRHPLLALSMAVSLLSLMGLPPLAGFVGKFLLFTVAFEAHYEWLAILAALNSVLSLYYYLRVIAPMYLQPPAYAGKPEPWAVIVAAVSALASLLLGLGVYLFLDFPAT
ncbi:NADH-quinone oxidoreductase subunit N [Thermithiobacillus plumbiphilus]|uniref:NADH-quinone oxidoreductase subunit N n=1 Tax=Thermithiobacillus plumbiphilus TaxID=1729899 RepID=A0ABU9D8F4_9PROT